jgi:hypothetical protein
MYRSGLKEGELMASRVVHLEEDNVVLGEEDMEGSGE